MKKLLVLVLAICFIPLSYADGTANIKIKISGAMGDNRYFLCLPNIGCLSILAAEKGKIFPVFHSFDMDNIYVTNMDNFKINAQGLPASCNVTVNTNQTITISGRITTTPNHGVYIEQLHCAVS